MEDLISCICTEAAPVTSYQRFFAWTYGSFSKTGSLSCERVLLHWTSDLRVFLVLLVPTSNPISKTTFSATILNPEVKLLQIHCATRIVRIAHLIKNMKTYMITIFYFAHCFWWTFLLNILDHENWLSLLRLENGILKRIVTQQYGYWQCLRQRWRRFCVRTS